MNDRDGERPAHPFDSFEQWMQTAARYFVLTNAGGAVAVLSFIGASGSSFPKAAIVPLTCFVAGLIVAGVVIGGQLTGAYQRLLVRTFDPLGAEVSIKRRWVTTMLARVEERTGHFVAIAFALFVVGAGTGLVTLALR
jgi:hypothetical protein